jgi:hypothetical protein
MPQPLAVKAANVWAMVSEVSGAFTVPAPFLTLPFGSFVVQAEIEFPFYFHFFFGYFFFQIHLTFLFGLIFLVGKVSFTCDYLVYFLFSFGLSMFSGFCF